jgi:uncharacterized protein (DUF2147 family)
MRIRYLILFSLFFFSNHLNAIQPIDGFWAKLNDNGSFRSIFAIYSHKNIYYGRIIATFNKEGIFYQGLTTPNKDKAIALVDEPPIIGLDLIWGLKEDKNKFTEGKILDPVNGKTYDLDAWIDKEGLLNIRGKLLFFWKDMKWKKISESQLASLGIDYLDLKSIYPQKFQIKNDK